MMHSISGWAIDDYLPPFTETASRSESLPWVVRPIETWADAAREVVLMRIAELKDGWDGGRARGVDRPAISNSRRLLDALHLLGSPPDRIFPSASGTVEFEWQRQSGSAHLEIGNSTFGFYTEPPAGEPIMDGGSVEVLDASKVSEAVATLETGRGSHSVQDWAGPLGVSAWNSGSAA